MKSATHLLAARYIGNRHDEHAISLMMFITGLSIFIGAFTLTLVTAVMQGIEYTVHAKMKNIHPSATIYAADPLNVDAIAQVITKEFPAITGISPYGLGHLLITTAHHDQEQPIVTLLKSIDPQQEITVTSLHKQLLDNSTLSSIHDEYIAIGKELAQSLGVSVGDSVSLLYIEQPSHAQKKVSIEEHSARIGSIFSTGIDDYDSGIIYCSPTLFATLFPDQGITQIGLAIAPTADTKTIVTQLQQRLQLDVHTWQELYPALLSALILEKYAMFFILLLITLVASMNIIALICMLITHKKADIAILCALGMSYPHLQRLFIGIGVGVAAIAALLGIATAWIACIILERYPFIQLPDVYYVSHLPAHMTPTIAIIVFCVVLSIAYMTSWFATRYIRSINIAHTLRAEG